MSGGAGPGATLPTRHRRIPIVGRYTPAELPLEWFHQAGSRVWRPASRKADGLVISGPRLSGSQTTVTATSQPIRIIGRTALEPTAEPGARRKRAGERGTGYGNRVD